MGPGGIVFDCNSDDLIIDCTLAKRHSIIKPPNTAGYGVSKLASFPIPHRDIARSENLEARVVT